MFSPPFTLMLFLKKKILSGLGGGGGLLLSLAHVSQRPFLQTCRNPTATDICIPHTPQFHFHNISSLSSFLFLFFFSSPAQNLPPGWYKLCLVSVIRSANTENFENSTLYFNKKIKDFLFFWQGKKYIY